MLTKTTGTLETPLRDQLERLAAFDPSQGPVISLYLDLRADQNGQRRHGLVYSKKALAGYPDMAARVERLLADEVPKSASGLALFAATQGDFFELIPVDVPIEHDEVFIGPVPHLYPLARLNDQYPRYAALLLDADSARLFVFGLGTTERHEEVQNVKTPRVSMRGWSQPRYQRRAINFHKAHIKEVVAILDRIVTDEHLNHIVVACDDTTRAMLMSELPKHLAEKAIDVTHLDVIATPNHEVLAETMEALRKEDAKTDAEEVQRMFNAWRAGGLAVAGAEATLQALEARQVETLLIAAEPAAIKGSEGEMPLTDRLVAAAQKNAARIRFIEDAALLSECAGVGALLRFRI